jgi:hypothetical protein
LNINQYSILGVGRRTSLGLKIMTRPIPDFNIPKGNELFQNILDITVLLVDGKNCLVHGAGESGRTS